MANLSQEKYDQISLMIGGVEEAELEAEKNQAPLPFSEFEHHFAISMKERLERYGTSTFVSEKQWRIINEIYEKVCF